MQDEIAGFRHNSNTLFRFDSYWHSLEKNKIVLLPIQSHFLSGFASPRRAILATT